MDAKLKVGVSCCLTVLAVMSVISGQTVASVGVDAVDAGGAMHASVSEMTFINVDLAIDAGEPVRALAGVSSHEVVAGAAIQARLVAALVDADLATLSFKTEGERRRMSWRRGRRKREEEDCSS